MPAQMKAEEQQKSSTVYRSTLLLLLVVFAGLVFARVVLFNILATSGQRLAAANQKIEILTEENQSLENELSKLQSLSKIENFAKKSGLVKAENIEILTPTGPIANR
jgi:cell division protein FtsL